MTPVQPHVETRIDLHVHSHHSDGTLGAQELAALAARRQVRLWSLTDHDTVAGCEAAAAASAAAGVGFVPGCELSCEWRGREIHVVGLAVDTRSAALGAEMQRTAAERRRRIAAIGEKLQAAGLPGRELAEGLLAGDAMPTRMHVARRLAELGHVRDPEEAFQRWIGRGQRAAVPAEWSPMARAVGAIVAAGGLPVLAHAHRYKLSNGALGELCAAFRAAGGEGLEVSLAGLSPQVAGRLASHARKHGLAGSVGSDFHEPGVPWRPLGRFDKLPEGIEPIAARLVARHA
jgi:predicted metal-dependent phosphoesterase TrpH